LRIQSKGFKLPAPFWRSIAKSLDPLQAHQNRSVDQHSPRAVGDGWSLIMLNDRENILSALREKPLKVYEIMKRANVVNEEVCQSLLLKMRGEGLVKFDIHKGRWLIG
jgi:hypothetical protein